ncbi:MAG: tetratricopeptide repeat protein, partial [Chthoniobacteraceae bacterium]
GGWVGWKWMHRPWRPMNPAVVEPRLALAAVRGPVIFGNPAALAWLEREKPALLPPEPQRARLAQATQDPRLFRVLDRELRFAEVWLLGEPAGFKPLVDHLIETKDFTLAHVDHTSLVFRREGGGWSEAELAAAMRAFADPRERAYAQALAASKLIAVRQAEPALKLLQAAEADGPDVPEVWSGWSTYKMSKGLWAEAFVAAEKALAIDPEFLPAIACRAQCYYATKRFPAALLEAGRMLAAQPDDPAMLFYHAKLAHEARAYQAEVGSLSRLIGFAEKAGANVSGYRVYLAQAYASANDADNAMDQVTLAMLDPELPREQRQFADELLQQLKRAFEGK